MISLSSWILELITAYITNICVYLSCRKMTIKEINNTNVWFYLLNLILTVIYVFTRDNVNRLIALLILMTFLSIIISKMLKVRFGYSTIVVLISFAIANIALLLGSFIGYCIYSTFDRLGVIIGVVITSTIQYLLIYLFFKIKRFKNGFGKLYEKLNKEMVDTIIIYVSVCVVLIAGLLGGLYDVKEERVANIFITFIILGITMYIMIQRTITMQYKHSLLLKTLEEYKEEIDNKNKEIEKLSEEKFKTSKIRHEFFNRQKALELMVKQNMSGDISKDGVSENVLKIVNELTSEYSKECEIIKGLAPLPKTDIIEIDSLFTYMQTECAKNNIDFKLNIQDSVHPLVNNHISKSRLETLLGDHIRDAINAVNKSDTSNKEILVVLGLKEDNYEICILDNGVEFSIDTLVKLGKEQVTTGGTGIGFLTTFETLKETKASLVITEFESGEYTKSVAVVFNNNCEYVINSYRAKEIIKSNDRKDVIIKEMKD